MILGGLTRVQPLDLCLLAVGFNVGTDGLSHIGTICVEETGTGGFEDAENAMADGIGPTDVLASDEGISNCNKGCPYE